MFRTNGRGAYLGNFLVSEQQAEECLGRWVSLEALARIRGVTAMLLRRRLSGYSGFLGVDMMVCRSGETFLVHPCVEVNLRMNMGVLAGCLQRRVLHPESAGYFSIEYHPSSEALRASHIHDGAVAPPVIRDGRLLSGYLALVPLSPFSRYRAFVKAFPGMAHSHCHSGLWP